MKAGCGGHYKGETVGESAIERQHPECQNLVSVELDRPLHFIQDALEDVAAPHLNGRAPETGDPDGVLRSPGPRPVPGGTCRQWGWERGR